MSLQASSTSMPCNNVCHLRCSSVSVSPFALSTTTRNPMPGVRYAMAMISSGSMPICSRIMLFTSSCNSSGRPLVSMSMPYSPEGRKSSAALFLATFRCSGVSACKRCCRLSSQNMPLKVMAESSFFFSSSPKARYSFSSSCLLGLSSRLSSTSRVRGLGLVSLTLFT